MQQVDSSVWNMDKIYQDCLNLIEFTDDEDGEIEDVENKVSTFHDAHQKQLKFPIQDDYQFENVFTFGTTRNQPNFGPIGSSPPTTPTTVSSACSSNESGWSAFSNQNVAIGFEPKSSFMARPGFDQGVSRAYEDLKKSSNFKEYLFKTQNQTLFKRLHVSNIPFSYRREHLYNIFSIFGTVLDTEIIFNERGSKGFGFVSFEDPKAAQKARNVLDNLMIDGRKIEVNYATPKPRRINNMQQKNKNQINSHRVPEMGTHSHATKPFQTAIVRTNMGMRNQINV